MRRYGWLVVVVVAAVAGTYWQRAAIANGTVSAKQIGTVEKQTSWFVAAGRIEPATEEITIGPEMDGKLKAVYVDEGMRVRRGQVVAELSNADYEARIATAKTVVREREAELERLRNGSRIEERREASAAVREAEAQLENARAERSRREALLARGAVSKSEYDATDRDFRTAQARLDANRERQLIAESATRPEDLRRAEAELSHAQAQVAESEALLAKTVLRSPVDGTVLRRYRKTGEPVSGNGTTPVLSLGDTHTLRIRADVDEADVARVFEGQRAYATAEAYGEKRFEGRVVRVGQALGRKNVRTDEPTERVDRKILEVLVELNAGQSLPVGLRMDTYFEASR